MNDSGYRGPSRYPGRSPSSDYGRTQDEREPEFEEEYQYRVSRPPRGRGDEGSRRPGRGPYEGGPPPGRRPSRPPESDAEFERRPMRKPRPSGPRDPEGMERQGRPSRRSESREFSNGPRSDPDWGARQRPRSGPDWGREPSPPADMERRPRRRRSNPDWGDEPSSRSGAGREAAARSRRSSQQRGKRPKQKMPLDPLARRQRRFRYLGLFGIMLFAGLGGVCINYGLVLPAVPLVLLALGSAGVFVYF